jgi:UDP-sugar transporter A1/2/3
VFLKYLLPSFLFCLYDNFLLVNISSKYGPTSYFILTQLRIVLTGKYFEKIFAIVLPRSQWISLVLLALGCALKHLSHAYSVYMKEEENPNKNEFNNFDISDYINRNLFIVVAQIFASSYACVHNEFILKENIHVDVMVQNIFMYVNAIIWNVLFLAYYVYSSDTVEIGLADIFSIPSLKHVFNLKVFLLMTNNAAIGIVTSLFLAKLNSILRVYASSVQFMTLSLLSMLIFGTEFNFLLVLSISFVLASLWVYSKNPVQ